MLAQSFQSADTLGLTDAQLSALQKTLVLLETGKLSHTMPDEKDGKTTGFTGHFNMAWWDLTVGCGTICCIGGTAEKIGHLSPSSLDRKAAENPELKNLFYPGQDRPCPVAMTAITMTQAARALRSYLTTGDAKWAEAVSA